jgi:hypothetical protein
VCRMKDEGKILNTRLFILRQLLIADTGPLPPV